VYRDSRIFDKEPKGSETLVKGGKVSYQVAFIVRKHSNDPTQPILDKPSRNAYVC
jgi:hypothetical protein